MMTKEQRVNNVLLLVLTALLFALFMMISYSMQHSRKNDRKFVPNNITDTGTVSVKYVPVHDNRLPVWI